MLEVVEKFVSINGEGQKAGELAVFIRFRGCNLDCSFCDTAWAKGFDVPCEKMCSEEIVNYVLDTGVKNVTLTGGEPLLQKEIDELIQQLLRQKGISVEIETNGSVNLSCFLNHERRPSMTMDYKLPGSGMESHMKTENFSLLSKKDTVKFVVGSISDMEKAKEIIDEYDLLKQTKVYFSPVFGKIEPQDMVDFMVKNNINDARLQLQLHKFIWNPEMRGV